MKESNTMSAKQDESGSEAQEKDAPPSERPSPFLFGLAFGAGRTARLFKMAGGAIGAAAAKVGAGMKRAGSGRRDSSKGEKSASPDLNGSPYGMVGADLGMAVTAREDEASKKAAPEGEEGVRSFEKGSTKGKPKAGSMTGEKG